MGVRSQIEVVRVAGDRLGDELARLTPEQWDLPGACGVWTVGEVVAHLTQWADAYRAFIEAQLISQLASNPLYQLQRAYGGVPEATGQGMPFGAGQQGQQFNPFLANVPFYG